MHCQPAIHRFQTPLVQENEGRSMLKQMATYSNNFFTAFFSPCLHLLLGLVFVVRKILKYDFKVALLQLQYTPNFVNSF
jgi:hypothetical protein